MSLRSKPLNIAYMIQNVGIDPTIEQVGDAVPVRYTLHGLRDAGHHVSLLMLKGRSIVGIDVNAQPSVWYAPLGLTKTRPFLFFESGVRRIQRMLRLPYFAFFDTYRFYEAALRCLPRYTICHEHNGLFSPASAMACRRLNIPYVLTFSADPIMEAKLLGRPLQGLHARVAAQEARFTYQAAHKIICVSNPAKQHLVQVWGVAPEKIEVMPNGVDVTLFGTEYDRRKVKAELGIGDSPVIGFVGGFQMWHGLDKLVESFARVLEKIPNAKLLFVGDGPARHDLERKIALFNVGHAAIITGMIPQENVPRMLAAIDVAVLPYPRLPQELWFSPLKLYEYMAAGKAIVASRSGQIVEVIRDNHNGILVEPGNVDELTQALVSLSNNPAKQKQLGETAHRQAINQHSWEQYIRRLENIYRDALCDGQA